MRGVGRRGCGHGPMTSTVPLPPMRAVGALQVSVDAQHQHPTYARLLAAAAVTGRCPVLITDFGLMSIPPAWDPEQTLADLATRDGAAVLAGWWPGHCAVHDDCLEEGLPGLAEVPGPAATRSTLRSMR